MLLVNIIVEKQTVYRRRIYYLFALFKTRIMFLKYLQSGQDLFAGIYRPHWIPSRFPPSAEHLRKSCFIIRWDMEKELCVRNKLKNETMPNIGTSNTFQGNEEN